jgi:hypothetical protein
MSESNRVALLMTQDLIFCRDIIRRVRLAQLHLAHVHVAFRVA